MQNDPSEMILRDHLAFDRTVMAVERTILAYIRTILVAFGAGFTLIKLFPEDKFLVATAWISFVVAAVSIFLAFYRFVKLKKSLKEIYNSN